MPRNLKRNCTFMNSASVIALISYYSTTLRISNMTPFRERSPNKMAAKSMEDPLCCCEYRNRRGERAHLLGLCCDCEDVDRSAILKLRISWFAHHVCFCSSAVLFLASAICLWSAILSSPNGWTSWRLAILLSIIRFLSLAFLFLVSASCIWSAILTSSHLVVHHQASVFALLVSSISFLYLVGHLIFSWRLAILLSAIRFLSLAALS